jgi:hypothetical protein
MVVSLEDYFGWALLEALKSSGGFKRLAHAKPSALTVRSSSS